jgi:hypothetical protein
MSSVTVGYSNNDMYYQNANYCLKNADGSVQNGDRTSTTECSNNKTAFESLVKTSDVGSKSKEKYDNIKAMYNREIIFAFNLIFGICALLYYIYVNQNAIPSMESIGKAATSAVSSVAEQAQAAATTVAK